MDAVLTSRHVSSFVELSLSLAFRREWSSTYESLQDSRPPRQALMKVYATELSTSALTVLAGDHTAWSRLHAETLAERTYEHQAQAGIEGSVVTVGQGYSTIAWVPEDSGSWALPFLHERILPSESPIGKAATQLHQVSAELSGEMLYLGDSEYGCAPFLKQTANVKCHKLLRLRPNRALYQAPPPYGGRGRPAQMETWSDLMPLLTWQLWLARDVVTDHPLPWQKPMTQLSPGRIADSFTSLLLRIGSPAPDPKPRGKSPGWTPGKIRTKRIRHPVLRKRPKINLKSTPKEAA